MLTYLGVPIFNTTWKQDNTTLTFTKKNGIVHYKTGKQEWQRWNVDDQTVFNHLKTSGFNPVDIGFTPDPNPIINKIREMESRRKPIYVQV